MLTFHQAFVFSHCNFFYLLNQIKSNCVYWLHWKSEKNRTEPNELDELKCSKSLNQTTSYAHWHAFLYLHAHIKYSFIYPFKNQKKNWVKWAKWAKILKNTLTEEHLCSLTSVTCFFVSACLNMYQNINSFIAFEIRKKDWAKWAKWARMLKNTLTDEQLCCS